MENIILYDWVSITSKVHSVQDIKRLIGMESVPWVAGNGSHGFPYAEYYECIKIHFGRDDGYVWLEMSGQGCRAFETYGNGDYELLFYEVIQNPGEAKITRLDVAFDDQTGIICMDKLCSDTRNGNFISRFANWQIIEGNKDASVCHGSMQSELYLRIYDKALERGYKDGRHWIRIELQLRRDRALQFIQQAGDIGTKFCGVLVNYVRYVEPDGLDQNKWRWPMLDYWAALCETAVKISLYVKPGTDYNLGNLNNFVFKMGGNAVDSAIKIYGIDGFLELLKEFKPRPNPKYTKLVEDSERIKCDG